MKKAIIILICAFLLTLIFGIRSFAAEKIDPPVVDHEFIYGYDTYYTNDPTPVFGYSFQKEAVEWTIGVTGNALYYNVIEGMEQYAHITKWRYYRAGEDGRTEAGWEIIKSTYTPTNGSIVINDVQLIGSDVDVYDLNGNKVFPPPRPALEVILEQTNQMIPNKVGGAMKILTLCGVGCLALLTVLVLFGKVLHHFRVK